MPDTNTYLDFIKEQEGFTSIAFKDNTQYSIGYGTATTDPDEISGRKQISEEEALRRLMEHSSGDREYITKYSETSGLDFNKNELDALTSFTYNTGRGNFDKLVEGRDKETIAEKMKLYYNSKGVQLEGLTTRRAAESDMFKTPVAEGEVVSPDDNIVDRSYLDYSEPFIPTAELRNAKIPQETPEGEKPSAGELWDAATYRHWISESVGRQAEMRQDEYDRDYRVDGDALMKYNNEGYSEQELTFLAESSSEVNFAHRVERIDSDRKVAQVIQQGGMKGTGMEMLAGIADPSLIPTLFIGGTAAAAGKWSSVKSIGMSLLNGAGQNVAAEYVLKMGDTQRTDADLMLAAAGGALFSGTITAGAIGYRSAKVRRAQANLIEAAHRDGVRAAMDGTAYNNADSALAKDVVDPSDRKRFLSEKEIMAKMQEETGTRADSLSVKKIKAKKQEFREYRKVQKAKIEAMRNSKIRPSAKNKQIAQLQRSIDVRETKLNELIADNNAKLQTNSNLDALQQGKVPDNLKARYDEIKRESGEYDSQVPANLKDQVPEPRKPTTDKEGVELPEGHVDSVGAMRSNTLLEFIGRKFALLTETEVEGVQNALNTAAELGVSTPRISRMASIAKGFRSLSTVVDMASDAVTRGMGIQLLKNGTRTIEGHQSAEELAEALFFRNVPDYMAQDRAFEDYAHANGIGLLSKGRQELRAEFDKLAVLEQVKGNVESTKVNADDSPILQAAKARARIYERGLKVNKDYDVVGFEKIEHHNSYHSVVYNAENILGANGTPEEIIDVIAKAYQTGGIKLTRENAERLAETQISRTFSYRNGSNGTFNKVMSDSEFKILSKELKEKGVDSTTIAELKATLFNKEELANLSPRAMFSLRPNLTASTGSVRMVDLVDTSIDRVMKYASDSSGNAGLASHGYHSRTQFTSALEAARTQSINDLSSVKYNDPKAEELRLKQLARANKGTDQQLLDDAVKLMYREPLQARAPDAVEDFSKIMRKQVGITRLRSTGLMTIPENAIAMVRNGAMNTLAQLPKSRYFNLTKRSIEGDEFMKNYAESFSATGHQEYLFGAKFYNNSDFDDATKSKLGNIINKVQGKAMNVTMTVNLFRSFQHGGEEMVARSIVNNLKELATSGKITPNIRKSLVKVGGLSEAQVDEMIEHFSTRKDVDIFDSVRQMPPKLHNAVSVAARNTIGSSFLRVGIGESVPYANNELGKIFTTLLNFSIGSWEKMVVRGVKSDGLPVLSAMLAGQSALALLSQYAYVYSRAAGKDEADRAKYIEKNLNDEGLFWGVFNRVGFLAAPSIPLQMLAAARLLPESIEASPTKSGVRGSSVPSVDMGADYFSAAGSTGALIQDTFDDKYMANKEREKHWGNIRRVLPWIDSPVYNFTIGQLD